MTDLSESNIHVREDSKHSSKPKFGDQKASNHLSVQSLSVNNNDQGEDSVCLLDPAIEDEVSFSFSTMSNNDLKGAKH